MDSKQHWDELADVYMVKNSITDWLLGYPAVLKLLGDLNSKTLLDLGCGSGRFSRFIAKSYPLARVIGVDTSTKAIDNAHKKTEESLGIEYHLINSHEDIDNYSFDVACANFLFCTTPNVDTLIAMTKKVHSLLPSGGIFVIMDAHPEMHGKKFTSFQSDDSTGLKSGDPLHVRLFTNSIDIEFDDFFWAKKDYEKILTAGGFNVFETMEPIAFQYNDERLGDERQFPPYLIFKAVK